MLTFGSPEVPPPSSLYVFYLFFSPSQLLCLYFGIPSHSSPSPSPLTTAPVKCNYQDLLLSQNSSTGGKEINLSFIPCDEETICFIEEELTLGQKEWELSLFGHAIDKRPFYGSLLAVVKKKWSFKGHLELLTMEGDFFLSSHVLKIMILYGILLCAS